MAKLDVTFESDIPKIVREGQDRRSKYDELLDKIKERAQNIKGKNKVAKLSFDSQGQATSRYTSVKDAVSKREDAAEWKVAVRRGEDEDGQPTHDLYIKWDPALAQENEKKQAPKQETQEDDADEDDIDF